MSYNTPADLRYTKSHEWVRTEGDEVVVGITDYAQHALGDVVYIELPEEGASYKAGDVFGVIESVKASSELYMPIGGDIIAVHRDLEDDQVAINEDPYEGGWMILVKPAGAEGELMDAKAYEAHVAAIEEAE
jgi:glycine cleavage system H protein